MTESPRRKWLALALLLGVQFMVVLDIAIVNVALPSIQTDLKFSQSNLQWVVSAYALFFGGFLLLFGRVADIVGRRRIFLFGIAVFTIASLTSGLAWSEGALIGARAFQGLGPDERPPRRRRDRARGIRRLGAAHARAARAGVVLPPAHGRRCECRRARARDGDLRDVPDADALHAAGSALLRDADGRCVSRRCRDRDLLVRLGGDTRQPHRRQA